MSGCSGTSDVTTAGATAELGQVECERGDVAFFEEVLGGFPSWVVAQRAEIRPIQPESWTEAQREVAEQYVDVPPVFVALGESEVLRGAAPASLALRESAASDLLALPTDGVVLVGEREGHGLVISVTDGVVTVLGDCEEPFDRQVAEFYDDLRAGDDATSAPEDAASLVSEMLRDSGSPWWTRLAEWREGPDPLDERSQLPADVRPLHPALSPPEVMADLNETLWSVELERRDDEGEFGALLVCPKASAGWSPCIELRAGGAGDGAFTSLYFGGPDDVVEFWLMPPDGDLTQSIAYIDSIAAGELRGADLVQLRIHSLAGEPRSSIESSSSIEVRRG